jgi:hypothetical protein
MFTKKLLGVIGIFSTFLFSNFTLAGDFISFEKKVSELERAVGEMNFETRYKEFIKIRKELNQLKKEGKRDSEENELSMSLFIETLSDFPLKRISKMKCSEIQKASQAMNRTSTEEAEENAFLLRAVKLSSNLCK